MSVEVDKRVVELQFDNKQFEKNVQTSLGTIDKLKMALDFDGAKGLDSITKAANKMDLSNVTKEVDRVQVSFSALQVAGMTMVSELTKTFLNFGKNLWNMSLGQMKSGGMARTLKIEQAEFKLKALAKNILKVDEDAKELTAYVEQMSKAAASAVDGTAYGYDSAMSVVSQLVASGINDANTMEKYLKGIAGAAAMTGRSFDDIGRIFSTVASNGKLMTRQLRQFSDAGFNVSAVLADELGTTEEKINYMVEKGQINFETFAEKISEAYGDSAQKADETYAGVTSNIRAQLSKVGQLFTDPYVKHMVPFLQKVKAAIKELRLALEPTAKRFDRFFGKLTEYAAVIVDQIDFSRLDTIVRGVENLLFGVAGVLYTIYQAFRDVFDKRTVEELREMAFNFERLTESLLPSAEALAGIRTSFKFLFSLLKVGVKIISALQKAMKPLIVQVFRILGAIISMVRHLEPLADSLIKFIKESSILEISMEIIAGIIETICNGIVILISILDELFGDIVTISTFKRIGEVLVDISNIINSLIIVSLLAVYALTKKIMSLVDPETFFNTINKIKNTFGYLFNVIVFGIDSLIETVHALLNSGTVIGNILKSVKELFGLLADIAQGKDLEERMTNLKKAFEDMGKSIGKFIDDFKEQMRSIKLGKLLLIAFAVGAVMLIFSLQRLTEAMVLFTNTARNTINIGATINKAFNSFANYSPAAQTLITFAIAIAAVTTSLVTLSEIKDTDKLMTAGKILGAFAAGLLATAVTLTLAYKYFMYKGLGGNVAQLAYVMIGISAALMLLVYAIKAMSNLTTDMKDLLSVSVSVVAIMGGLAASVGIMAKLAPEFQTSMWSILSFAASTLILVKALDMLKSFDIAAIWKQAVLLGGLMLVLGAAMGLASRAAKQSTMFTNEKAGTVSEYKRGSIGGSLLMFALSMKILLGVFQDLCAMPIEQLNNGIKRIRSLIMEGFIPLFLSLAIINRFSKSSGEFVADVAKMFSSMAISMIVIFASIALFSALPKEDLDKAVSAMSSIMMSMGKMIAIIMFVPLLMTTVSSLSQVHSNKKIASSTYNLFSNFKGILLALAGLLLTVSLLCIIAKDMDADAMINLTFIFGLIIGVLTIIGLMAGLSKGAKAAPILATLTVIIAVVGALAFLAAVISTGGLDLEEFMGISLGMAAVFAGLGIMLAGISMLMKKTAGAKDEKMGVLPTILIVLGAIAGFVLIVKYAKDVKFDTVIAIFGGMAAVLLMMAILIGTMKKVRIQYYARLGESMKVVLPAVALFATMVASFIALALVLNKVSDDAWGKALITIGIISLLMLTMGVVMDKAAENAGYFDDTKGIMSAMWSMVGMVAVLGLVIAAITAIPATQGYLAKLVALGVLIAMLVIFLDRYDFAVKSEEQMLHMKAFAKAFAIMCAGILAIAAAIVLVTKADFTKSSGWQWKMVMLALAIGAIAGILVLLTMLSKDSGFSDANLVVMVGSFVAMCAGLILIAEAVEKISNIRSEGIDQAMKVITKLLGAFALIAVVAGIASVIGVGGGLAVAIQGVMVAFLMFGAGLLLTAKSIDIFADAMIKFTSITTDGVNQIADNIETFLARLPGLNKSLEEHGHDLTRTLALIIINAADAVGMASGAIIGAGLQMVVSFCAGILEALPTILDTVGKVFEAINQWILTDGKEVLYDTGKALMEGLLAIGQGLIDGLFDYFGVRLDELWQSINDAKDAIENNKKVHETGSTFLSNDMEKYWDRMVKEDAGHGNASTAWKFYDMMQERIDMGLMSYEDAVKTMDNVGLYQYSHYLSKMGQISDYDAESREMAIKRYEASVTDEAKAHIDAIRKEYNDTKMEDMPWWAGGGKEMNWNKAIDFAKRLNEEVKKGTISYRYAIKVLHDEGLTDGANYMNWSSYIEYPSQVGAESAEALADGIESNSDKIEDAVDNVATIYENGAERIEVATSNANKAGGQMGVGILNKPQQTFSMYNGADLSKLARAKEFAQSEKMGELQGELTAEGAEEGFQNETEKTNFILDTISKYGPALKNVGLDLGTYLGDGMIQNFSSRADVINGILGGLGGTLNSFSTGKSTDEWRDYYKETLPTVSEINGMKTVGRVARWQAEGYKSLDEAVRDNSAFGEDWWKNLSGWVYGEDGDASEIISDFTGELDNLTSGLGDVSDAEATTTDYTDKLKESIEEALDVFTEFNKEVKLTGREVLANLYSQLDGVQSWQKELEELATRGMNKNFLNQLAEEGPKSYDKIHAFYTMTEAEMTLFNTMYAQKLMIQRSTANDIRKSFVATGNIMQDELDKFETSIGEQYDEKVARAQAKAANSKAGTIAESTQKSLEEMQEEMEKEAIDTEFINNWTNGANALLNLKQHTEEATISFDNFNDEIKTVLTELNDLQKEGNVNLLMRPTIDANLLNEAGYDAGDGFATMFTSTFSNETEDIAMNFTPIMVDPKTGKYLGVMSPDEFNDYCQDVVDGVKKDTFNLKVGMTFKGKNAIEEATEAAERIHELHEELGQDWNEDEWSQIEIKDISDNFDNVKLDLANAFSDIGYASIDAFAQSMNFQKVMEKILQFKQTVKEQVKSSLNLFDEVKEVEEKDKMTTTEILNNMEENLKRVGGWSYNLRKMIKMGFSEGLIEELRQMGPESADKVEAFVKMTADEVSRANAYWGESVQLPESISNRLTDEYAKAGFEISLGLKKGLEEGSDDFYDKFRVAGENASRGYVDGIDADAANDTMRELGENTLFKIMEALDEHSPSRKMMEIGYNVVAGFMIGINNTKKSLWKTIEMMSDEVVSKFETMGKYCADGLSNGLVKGTSNLGSVIGGVASKMANTFASVLKIESPSKVFYDFGKYIVMGLEKGLTDEEDPLIDTVVDTGDKIVDTMANKLYKLGSDPNLYYKTDRWAKYYPEPVYRMTTMTQVAANRNAYNNDNWSWSPGVKQDSGSMYGRYGTVRDPALDNPDADWKVDLATGFTYMKLNLDNVNSTMNNLSQKSEESKEMYKTTNEYIKTMTDSINRMSNDISSLGDRMSNMEVRLDGNALVGQIVAPLDKAMGKKVITQKRGRM